MANLLREKSDNHTTSVGLDEDRCLKNIPQTVLESFFSVQIILVLILFYILEILNNVKILIAECKNSRLNSLHRINKMPEQYYQLMSRNNKKSAIYCIDSPIIYI